MGIDKSNYEVIADNSDYFGGYSSTNTIVYIDEKHNKKLTVDVMTVFGSAPSWEKGKHYSNIRITELQ
jgi:hypothetical protein